MLHSLNSIQNFSVQLFNPSKRTSIANFLADSKTEVPKMVKKTPESQLKMINALSLHISPRDEILLKKGHLSRNRVYDQTKIRQMSRNRMVLRGGILNIFLNIFLFIYIMNK